MTNLTALERRAGTRTSSLGRLIKAMNGADHGLALGLSQESANPDPHKATGQLRALLIIHKRLVLYHYNKPLSPLKTAGKRISTPFLPAQSCCSEKQEGGKTKQKTTKGPWGVVAHISNSSTRKIQAGGSSSSLPHS